MISLEGNIALSVALISVLALFYLKVRKMEKEHREELRERHNNQLHASWSSIIERMAYEPAAYRACKEAAETGEREGLDQSKWRGLLHTLRILGYLDAPSVRRRIEYTHEFRLSDKFPFVKFKWDENDTPTLVNELWSVVYLAEDSHEFARKYVATESAAYGHINPTMEERSLEVLIEDPRGKIVTKRRAHRTADLAR